MNLLKGFRKVWETASFAMGLKHYTEHPSKVFEATGLSWFRVYGQISRIPYEIAALAVALRASCPRTSLSAHTHTHRAHMEGLV